MLMLSRLARGAKEMAKTKRKRKPIDWDAMELQAFNLRFEPISPQDKVKKARKLAATFWKHNQPLPDELADAGLMQDDYSESYGPE